MRQHYFDTITSLPFGGDLTAKNVEGPLFYPQVLISKMLYLYLPQYPSGHF